MHELPIIKNVLKIVLMHAEEEKARQVRKVILAVGELHDLVPELINKYFAYISRGTIAQEAELVVNIVPIFSRCNACHEHFVFHLRYGERTEGCPACGGDDLAMLGGDELAIDCIEVC